jgi:hypothetical protein
VQLSGSGPVLLLGSAPTAIVPPDFAPHWTLVCVNASQASADALGLPRPRLVVLRKGVFYSQQVDLETAAALAGRSAEAVAIRDEEGERGFFEANLNRIGYRYDRLVMLGRSKRERIILNGTQSLGQVIAINRDLSNGIFSLFASIDLFRQPVVMSGFSFSVAGHAYNASNLPRAHVDQDRKALRIIRSRGWPVYASEAKFAEESGLPLWKGSPS